MHFCTRALKFVDLPAIAVFSAGYLQECLNEGLCRKNERRITADWNGSTSEDCNSSTSVSCFFLRLIFFIFSCGGCICTFCWKFDLVSMSPDRHISQMHLILSVTKLEGCQRRVYQPSKKFAHLPFVQEQTTVLLGSCWCLCENSHAYAGRGYYSPIKLVRVIWYHGRCVRECVFSKFVRQHEFLLEQRTSNSNQ